MIHHNIDQRLETSPGEAVQPLAIDHCTAVNNSESAAFVEGNCRCERVAFQAGEARFQAQIVEEHSAYTATPVLRRHREVSDDPNLDREDFHSNHTGHEAFELVTPELVACGARVLIRDLGCPFPCIRRIPMDLGDGEQPKDCMVMFASAQVNHADALILVARRETE